ncbi:TRAP transporter small permease subunit [Pusillimonas sp. MFBS29]|uniref:TRAP transporter small permease subunit n=1 Tax=Pusillimonas sp. MFBS29 TaxID=2886690 RepID=UPI001D0F5C7D|nr:TRAP transporter small permease subunit [Pusillimonas sp. MFBS29]MCC2597013.1 TRAP transporter small permease subunit [Pusillimonas sp. MFBS29]
MLNTLTRAIERVITTIGHAVALLVLVMIALVVTEMFSRGVLGYSLPWVQDLCAWLLTILVMIGGPYALLRGQFVRVDIFFARLNPRNKALVDTIFSTVLIGLFVWVLVDKGGSFFLASFAMDERSATGSWSGPVWVAKSMIPLGGVMLGFAWFAHIVRAWHDVIHPTSDASGSDGSSTLGM